MPDKTNITATGDVAGNPREIDFVSKFADNWQALLEIIGVSNMVEKQSGTSLHVKKGGCTLSSSPAEGELIPLSQCSVTDASIGTITLEKYKKEVTMENIDKFGYDIAVGKTDKAFENALRKKVMDKFYAFLSTGTLSCSATGVQATLSLANGYVRNAFRGLQLDITGVVGFMNMVDFYTYLGNATITVQNEFGYTYVKNFLGYDVLFLCADGEVASGKKLGVFLTDEIFKPLGMVDTGFRLPEKDLSRYTVMYDWPNAEHPALWPHEVSIFCVQPRYLENSFESGGAGLVSTVDDYARFVQMLLNGGEYEGVRILKSETVKIMLTPTLAEAAKADLTWDSLKGYTYTNLFRILESTEEVGYNGAIGEFGWDGWTGNFFFGDPENKIVFLYFVQLCGGGDVNLMHELARVIYNN